MKNSKKCPPKKKVVVPPTVVKKKNPFGKKSVANGAGKGGYEHPMG